MYRSLFQYASSTEHAYVQDVPKSFPEPLLNWHSLLIFIGPSVCLKTPRKYLIHSKEQLTFVVVSILRLAPSQMEP